MKIIALMPLASLFACFASCKAGAETGKMLEAPNEATPTDVNQQAFRNLPEESRNEFLARFAEAKRLFDGRKISATLAELGRAAAIFPDSPVFHNLRGSCHVEMRDFDHALDDFSKAAGLSKNNPSIEFNIGEVIFVTKQWDENVESVRKSYRIAAARKH